MTRHVTRVIKNVLNMVKNFICKRSSSIRARRQFETAAIFWEEGSDNARISSVIMPLCIYQIRTYSTLSLKGVRACSQSIMTAAVANTKAMFIVAYSSPMQR